MKSLGNETNQNDEYEKKIESFFLNDLKKIKNPNVIEFGVRNGISTKKIIKICEENQGFLHAVDNEDCSKVSNSSSWQFHFCRDDDFEYLDKVFDFSVDLIYLDSFHEAKHVEKIFYHYYPLLKTGGLFIFDDISWLPYLKNKKRNNFNCEINNSETFIKILEIFSCNEDKFELSFNFNGSGLAKIKKISDDKLSESKKLILRGFSLKNMIRKILISMNIKF